MVSRSGSVQGRRLLRLRRWHSRAHCVGHGHLLHVRLSSLLPSHLIVWSWLRRTRSLSGRGRRNRGRTWGWRGRWRNPRRSRCRLLHVLSELLLRVHGCLVMSLLLVCLVWNIHRSWIGRRL